MMAGPQIRWLQEGRRLHLHHGPIDLICEIQGPDKAICFEAIVARFETILDGLVSELPRLRKPVCETTHFCDPVALRMNIAVSKYSEVFVTPMAAVAGAVADEILETIPKHANIDQAYVNNGGDIALKVAPGHHMTVLGAFGTINLEHGSPIQGVATSGWRGRSHSLGIADLVTVQAQTAADADVAATLIANAVNLPGHPAITRIPAQHLFPDSDLGQRAVTTDVAPLNHADRQTALNSGLAYAAKLCASGRIFQADLALQNEIRNVTAQIPNASEKVPDYA